MPRALRLLALLALPAVLAGCGSSSGTSSSKVSGDVLRIYSSQPRSGLRADQAQAIERGERLALADAHNRVGKWRIEYLALDDADPKTGNWDPGLVSANARKAAQDDKTIAYLGEMDTGASAVSIPILNETGILEVSPTDTVAGFTRDRGAAPGEPDKYYPTRDRTFARLVPPDDVQAEALLALMQDVKAKRLYVAQDQRLYGQSLAHQVASEARKRGIELIKVDGVDPEKVDPRQLATDVAASGADAFLYAGDQSPRVAQIFQAVSAAAPKARLFGPSALTNDAFAAQLGQAASRTLLTAPWLAVKAYPAAGQQLARRYEQRYGGTMPPQALYGYEAMSAVLAAIQRAGSKGNERGKVIDRMLGTRNRASVLGTYSIDHNGDTSIKVYGAWRVRAGRLQFVRVLDPLGA